MLKVWSEKFSFVNLNLYDLLQNNNFTKNKKQDLHQN